MDNPRFAFLGGGLVAGAAMAATGAGVIPPWPAAVIWFAAVLSFWYGLPTVFGNRRWLRLGTSLVAFWVAFEVWQVTSPRADIRIEGVNLISDGSADSQLGLNVHFRNRGMHSANFRIMGAANTFNHETIRLRGLRAVEDEVRDEVDKLARDRSMPDELVSESPPAFFTVTKSVTPEFRRQFIADERVLVVVGRIIYRDWWVRDRPSTEFCFIARGKGLAVNSCS